MPRSRHALSAALAIATLAGAAAADVIHVPADAPTIQDAINLAEPGDEIIVAPGVYTETIEILGKALTIRAAEGPDVTTIDAGGTEAFVVTIRDANDGVTIDGFTITGGLGATGGPERTGGGILAHLSTVNIHNAVITGNSNITGGGLESVRSTLNVLDTAFTNNAANQGGGAFTQGRTVTFERVTFENNFATNFGGAIASALGTVNITEAEMTANTSNQFGGAIYANSVSSLNISQLRASDNGSATFGDNSINFSTFGGGAIYTTNTSGRIDRSLFTGNRAFAGGAVYVAGSGTLEIVNSVMTGAVSSLGGGVYANSSSPRIINCTIINNPWGLFTTWNSFPTVRNTILSGNSSTGSSEIGGNGVADVAFSIVNGTFGSVSEGPGFIQLHPQLDDDFSPTPGSPVINAGDNNAVPDDIELDFLGNARIFSEDGDPTVDIGAIEFGSIPPSETACLADMTGNGALDVFDVIVFLAYFDQGHALADINGDGRHDIFDVVLYLEMFDHGCP